VVADGETHCLVNVIGQTDADEWLLSAPICTTGSAADLLAANGVREFTGEGEVAAGARAGTLARHYDGANFTGSSISVAGGSCNGGWYNVPSWFDNRISSTVAYAPCSRIKHYDGDSLNGSYQSTWPSGNLSYMNNRAESIEYSY